MGPKTAVWKETMVAIFFHSLFSLILLIPMAVTGGSNVLTVCSCYFISAFKVHKRHILVKEYLREPMEEEEAAFDRITMLAWMLPMTVLLTSALDLLMAYSYIK